jgi:hypothetical protein
MTTKAQATVANTPVKYYLDSEKVQAACRKAGGKGDFDTIDDKCKPETEAAKKDKLNKKKDGIAGLLGKIKGNKGNESNKGAKWINDHCEFLMIKPVSGKEMFDELMNLPETMAKDMGKSALEAAIQEAKDKVTHEIEKKVAEIMLKKGATKIAGRALSLLTGPFAIVINVAMTAYDVYDAKNTYDEVAKEFSEKFEKIKQTTDKLAQINEQIDDVKKLLSGDQYKTADGRISPEKVVSDAMYAAAEINDCTSARRCLLVPYEKTNQVPGMNDGKGCCPGQSGHHILPSAMFKGCPSYNEDNAPTICVEGTKNWAGSHKRIHDKLRQRLQKLPVPAGGQLTMDQAVEAGTKSVEDAFPALPPPSKRGCDPDCIKAQLKEFYDNLKCPPPKNVSGASGGDGKIGTNSN